MIKRNDILENLKSKKYDLLVIGGGITGAGIALDAASRGLSVALVEKGDFASGTSSKSTKLIHGGLRYLKQLDFSLVHEVGRERAIVHKLAPNLVKPEKMLLPLVKNGTYGKLLSSFGLALYDFLAGVKKEECRKMLNKEDSLQVEPLLNEETLLGSGLYYEYRTDDARLTIEIIKSAIERSADCLNYIELKDFDYKHDGSMHYAKCVDHISKEEFMIEAELIVNSTGPWVDKVRLKQQKEESLNKRLHLTKGIHLVVDYEKFPIKQSVYFDEKLKGRMLFAIPRDKTTYIGTTDTNYSGSLDDIRVTKEDEDYVLKAVNSIFPEINLSASDIKSSWAGLRPLIHQEGKSPSELSRKDEIFESEDGLISIAGGKLTGYRKMSERIVDRVSQKLKERSIISNTKKCITEKLKLDSSNFESEEAMFNYRETLRDYLRTYFEDNYFADHIFDNYGLKASKILDYFKHIKIEQENIKNENAIVIAELIYGIDYEMINSVLDFCERRSSYLYFDIDLIKESKELILREMSIRLSWNDFRLDSERKILDEALEKSFVFV